MDTRWQPLTEDARRTCTIAVYDAGLTPLQIADGAVGRDLTPLVSRARQSEAELTVTLVWHDELYGPNMPTIGQWLAATLNGQLLCVMLIESINDYRLRSGERSATLTARTRDGTSAFRDELIATPRYFQGTLLTTIATYVAYHVGMTPGEVIMPVDGYSTPQAAYQASNITPWELITQCLLVMGYSPFVDAIGRLRAYSRNLIWRPSDMTIPASRVVGFIGSRAVAPIDKLTVKWREPWPKRVEKTHQVLGTAQVTAGYWKKYAIREMYWSEDRTQLADIDPELMVEDYHDTVNSPLFVKEDINSGLIPVGKQYFEAIYATLPDGSRGGCIGGRVRVEMTHERDRILTILIAAKIVASFIPDFVVAFFGGVTIPVGRIIEAATVDVPILTLLCKMGTGFYEVRGTMYDLANPVNQTIAYDPQVPNPTRSDTIESDLVLNEETAQIIAVREYVFRVRSASQFSLTIVDDPRIELGDVVALEDGTRLFVTGLSRDLSSGSQNLLELVGFAA